MIDPRTILVLLSIILKVAEEVADDDWDIRLYPLWCQSPPLGAP